jgi:hypothetical protein
VTESYAPSSYRLYAVNDQISGEPPQESGGPPQRSAVGQNVGGTQGTVISGDIGQTIYSYDLTAEKARIPADQLVEVGQEEFERKIRGRQEWVRTALAVGAFLSLVAVLGFLLGSVYNAVTVDNIEKIATVVVTPLTGIVGTIIGFYFAERRSGGTRE